MLVCVHVHTFVCLCVYLQLSIGPRLARPSLAHQYNAVHRRIKELGCVWPTARTRTTVAMY